MKTIAERLNYLIRDVYNTSPLAFSQKYNDPKGVKTYNILSGRNGVSNKMLETITSAYPEINPAWLLTGTGVPTSNTHHTVEQLILGNHNIQARGNAHVNANDSQQVAMLKAQIRERDIRLQEKDEIIKEKDRQISRLLDIIAKKTK